MEKWTVDYIEKMFEMINKKLKFNVKPGIVIEEKNKFPMAVRDGKLIVIPDYFNDGDLDEYRNMILVLFYSYLFLVKDRNYLPVNPEVLAKGICDEVGIKYIPSYELYETMCLVRRKLYKDIEYGCGFSIDDELRVDITTSYRITNIQRESDEKIWITVQPLGTRVDEYIGKTVFEEKELFNLCYNLPSCVDVEIDISKKNLYILSGPSCAGKNSVFALVQKKCPQVKKVITATTRKPREGEIDGVDYYFLTMEELEKKSKNNEFIEEKLYAGNYYGILHSEIAKYSNDTPVFLLIDPQGKSKILHNKYPLAKTIFLMPPSIEELERRMINRGANTPDEMQRRLESAKHEMEQAKYYDYIIVNDDVESSANKIVEIIKQTI